MQPKVELIPQNKYMVVKDQAADDKIGEGILYAAGSRQDNTKLATVLAFFPCDEAKGLSVGATIIYDSLGAETVRVGNQSFTIQKAACVKAVVLRKDAE